MVLCTVLDVFVQKDKNGEVYHIIQTERNGYWGISLGGYGGM